MLDPDQAGMPGPDREFDYIGKGSYEDYYTCKCICLTFPMQAASGMPVSFTRCPAIGGGLATPCWIMIRIGITGGVTRDDKGGKDNGSGGNDTSGSGGGTNETKKTTETKETKAAEEQT